MLKYQQTIAMWIDRDEKRKINNSNEVYLIDKLSKLILSRLYFCAFLKLFGNFQLRKSRVLKLLIEDISEATAIMNIPRSFLESFDNIVAVCWLVGKHQKKNNYNNFSINHTNDQNEFLEFYFHRPRSLQFVYSFF